MWDVMMGNAGLRQATLGQRWEACGSQNPSKEAGRGGDAGPSPSTSIPPGTCGPMNRGRTSREKLRPRAEVPCARFRTRGG